MRVAHQQMKTFAIGQFACHARQGLGAGTHEARPQQQVFWRIAGQGQFGREDQCRALRVRPPSRHYGGRFIGEF